MNQEKIGKFIAENRRLKKITQSELAEMLGVTDRSVSNWENGKNMPDLSLFKPLCDILGITINELMCGEKINNKEYNEKLEENIINTIDYIDKKSVKISNTKSFCLLIVGIIGICLAQLLFNDNELNSYLTVISMVLVVYSVKCLFIKYRLARRIVSILLVVICIFSIILSK